MYLIAVNVLNVAAFVLLCVVCGFLPEAEAFFTYSMLVLSALGGAFGMLAVLLFISILLGAAGEKAQNRGDDGDSLLYIVAVALSLLWVVAIYLAWSGDIASGQVDLRPMSHVPLIAYLVAINVATIVVLLRDDEQRRKSTLHPREIGVLALAVAGGSAGALLALGLKRSGTNTSRFITNTVCPSSLAPTPSSSRFSLSQASRKAEPENPIERLVEPMESQRLSLGRVTTACTENRYGFEARWRLYCEA